MTAQAQHGDGCIHEKIRGRVFLVGCPRSGTTLLQGLLAAHPRMASFPESHFFPYVVPDDPEQRADGIASEEAGPRWKKLLDDLGRPDLDRILAPSAPRIREFADAFSCLLDTLTLEQSKDWWLEKTPDHIRFVDEIELYVPRVRFVHLVRSGPDVVASLYGVTRQHPRVWDGPWSLDRCIEKWNADVARTGEFLHRTNHYLVRYEELIARPMEALIGICEFLNLEFRHEMLKEYPRAVQSLIRTHEVWKRHAAEPLSQAHSKKFENLLEDEQRNYVLARLILPDYLRHDEPFRGNREPGVVKGGTVCCYDS